MEQVLAEPTQPRKLIRYERFTRAALEEQVAQLDRFEREQHRRDVAMGFLVRVCRSPAPASAPRRAGRQTRKRPVRVSGAKASASADDGDEPPPAEALGLSGPLTEGETAFLDFLFDQAVTSWSS